MAAPVSAPRSPWKRRSSRDWLEIEAGVTALSGGGQTQWSTNLLFKKPWTLSKTVEFEVGAGTGMAAYDRGPAEAPISLGGEAVAEFLFWPWPASEARPEILEPSYGYDFGGRHDQSLGVSVGLLIPIPEAAAAKRAAGGKIVAMTFNFHVRSTRAA